MTRTYHYDWTVDLKSAPAALWPFVADTNRFNHETGLPPIEYIPNAPDVRPGARRLRFRIYGVSIAWDEEPFDWVFPYRFGVIRHYKTGPVARMDVRTDLSEKSDGGTQLRYQVWATPRNVIGDMGIWIQIGLISASRFAAIFKRYDDLVQRGAASFDPETESSRFVPGGRERLSNARPAIVQSDADAALFERMSRFITTADDFALQRIRPYQLADYWRLPRRATLEAFLRAAQAGIFDLRWELLCPGCRGTAASHGHLDELHNSAHCDFCNRDFTANFDQQVEVTFRPNAAVRVIPERFTFCIAGPQSGPHVRANETVPANKDVMLQTVLDLGQYDLRASGIMQALPVTVADDSAQEFTIELDSNGWSKNAAYLAPRVALRVLNKTAFSQALTLSRAAWRDDIATAADVTSLQVFRDLFAREALRPGEEIGIESVTLMFTDLRNSTRLYRQIGDASAFGRVREHFEILERAIAAEGGAIVKTIGDAVMAVFRQPGGALKAVRVAHAEIQRTGADPMLYLKIGIHRGPCIAVTLNDRLDYFGSTVNIVSRFPGLAAGGEVILSEIVFNDPEVQALLKDSKLSAQMFKSDVKGYDEPFDLWRVKL